MKKIIKWIMIILLTVVVGFSIAVYLFMQQTKFGRIPSGERLERIKKSPHYKDGSFKNLRHTPDLTEGVSYYAVMKEFIFSEKKRVKPIDTIPSIKTNLLNLDPK